jgi:hypothetical protein
VSPILSVCSCGAFYEGKGGCLLCRKADNRRRNDKSQRHGLRSEWWPVLREQVLARARGECEWTDERGYKCRVRATIADYIPGGVHSQDLSDYQALCHYHSGVKDGARSHA